MSMMVSALEIRSLHGGGALWWGAGCWCRAAGADACYYIHAKAAPLPGSQEGPSYGATSGVGKEAGCAGRPLGLVATGQATTK